MTWNERAACIGHDVEIFFPDARASGAAAKLICRGCPVKQECLDWALRTGQHYGVFGGLTESQRHRMTRTPPVARPECGTSGGANRHYSRRERLCKACLEAARERSRAKRAVPTGTTAPKVAERGVQPQQWGPQGGRGTAGA